MLPIVLRGARTHNLRGIDRKSTRLNSSHTVIYTLPYTTLFRSVTKAESEARSGDRMHSGGPHAADCSSRRSHPQPPWHRSEEHTSELQSHSDLHSSLHDALPICDQG